MNSNRTKIFQVLLALGLIFILFLITTVRKVLELPLLSLFSDLFTGALIIVAILLQEPFSRKFENNPLEGIKFILLFLFLNLIPILIIRSFKIISITRQGEFIIPESFNDIIFINFTGIILIFILAVIFAIFLKVISLRRGVEIKKKLILLFSIFAVDELLRIFIPGQLMEVRTALGVTEKLIIMWISLKIPWILTLIKKEKYKILGYSFIMLIFVILLSAFGSGNWKLGIEFYSGLLHSFYGFVLSFLGTYAFFLLASTIFHLPTSEIYERKIMEISTLQTLGKLVAQVLDLKEFSETATRIAREMTGAKSAWIEIISDDGPSYTLGRSNIDKPEIELILEKISDLKRNLLTENPGDKKHLLIDEIIDNTSILIIPLIAHNKISGFLYLTNPPNRKFDEDSINLTLTFANHIAIAIENSRLVLESIEKERLKRDIELARQMQKKLLPSKIPSFDRLEISAVSIPALEVGGDYYDFAFHNNNRFSIIIGDVSGKGISAAFYMSEMKGIFQSLSKIYPFPRDFLIKANETISEHIDRKFFITLIYAIFDVERNTVQISRAGHCPPLIVKDGKVNYMKTKGIGLGIAGRKFFNRTIECKKLKFKKGDMLILYSDGIIETMNEKREEFGYDRLLQVISQNKTRTASEIVEIILDEIKNYRKEMPQIDDITIVTLKWKK